MPDLRLFAELVSKAGLMDKSFATMNREEVESIIGFAFSADAMPSVSTSFEPPSIIDGNLIIPFNSDPKYHYWKRCGQSIFATLREIGASEEVFQRYMHGTDDVPF